VAAKSGKTFETIDPTTEIPLTTIALADVEDIDFAVKAARRAFEKPSWANIGPYQRSNYLLRIADLIEKHCEELATIQWLDMGMLLAQSRGMTAAMADVFRYYAGWTTKIYGRTFPSDGSSMTYTLREPLGVIRAIIPWNGPVLATAWKIAPAIACGNTIVLKPAEQAPLVSLRMAELIQEAGLPDGVVNVVTGFGDAGAALVAHRDVNKISFTGSTDVGKQILSASAGTLKRVTL
jgi:acyl-CoA reductase-like NAD-dependent aldehyde dehydrogenase